MLSGALHKMQVKPGKTVGPQDALMADYTFLIGDQAVPMATLIGKTLRLRFEGSIHCQHCQRRTKKSFNQGFCYPCFKALARCDMCIMKPELCHYHLGTCREPVWGETHCMQPHVVYLAYTSHYKVGITRGTQVPTRWYDQGALMAVPLVEAQTRYQVGLIEDAMRTWLSDRTHWSRMLKGNTYPEAFDQEQASVLARLPALLTELLSPEQAAQCRVLEDAKPMTLAYPTEQLPEKVVSRSFDKTPVIEGRLLGVKGQYWILDTGVLNIRKHTAYDVVLEEVG